LVKGYSKPISKPLVENNRLTKAQQRLKGKQIVPGYKGSIQKMEQEVFQAHKALILESNLSVHCVENRIFMFIFGGRKIWA
jgi:hypothetical protein